MNALDWFVLLSTMLGIAGYGIWKTRRPAGLATYLKGNQEAGWATLGISVMATQASAITFLSIPGQGYESGLGFVQNYFGLPLALIVVSAVFLPIYRRLGVYTAYEYLGQRFDTKTRVLGASLFLIQRGLASGITIYAPAIILSTVLGWPLNPTIIGTGLLVIVYTVSGGNAAVSLTQKGQMAVIFAGMLAAFVVLLSKIPEHLSLSAGAELAGLLGKMEAVDFSLDPTRRYTFWSGLLGGFFLSLSYFGADQSQVQRYIGGAALREGRLGLMFNALLKIPMQFFILLLGVGVFVFAQFQPTPVFHNRVEWARHTAGPEGATFRALEEKYATLHAAKQEQIRLWLAARHQGDAVAQAGARTAVLAAQAATEQVRSEAKAALRASDARAPLKDSDYVFINFVLAQLPHGWIGLLVAVMFAAALGSKAGELSALGTTTTLDLWRRVFPQTRPDEARDVNMTRLFTVLWGLFAIAFALVARFAENLIELINIIGSLAYGVPLGLFLVAFFLPRVGGTAIFCAGLVAQLLVVVLYLTQEISYLWYNFIGCAACMLLGLLLQTVLPAARRSPPDAPPAPA